MRFSTSKNSVSVKVLIALGAIGATGIASAASSSTQAAAAAEAVAAQPNSNPDFVKGVITTTGVNTAVTIGNTVSGIVGGGGVSGGGFAALPAGVTRFALPGQGGTGAAAAPGGKAFNAWFAYSRSDIAYDYRPLKSDGNVDVYLLGVDYTLKSNAVIGLALAVDRSDIDLKGATFGPTGGKMKGKGNTLSLYGGLPINKNWAADVSVGFGRTEVDTTTSAGGITSSDMDDDRTTFAAGLAYRQLFGADSKWMLTGRGGYIFVKDKLGSYTMSNGTFVSSGRVEVSQLRFGGQAAYNFGMFVPYAGLTYIYDFKEPNQPGAANDRTGMQGSLGIRFNAPSGLYGGLQYSSEFSRSQIKNDQILLNIGSRF
jgi:hypothetical protein